MKIYKIVGTLYIIMLISVGSIVFFFIEGCTDFPPQTRVDGIYTADPEKDSSAKRYETISFDEVYTNGLNVMDMTAFTLCNENKLPIIVFDMNKKGNLKAVLSGEQVGTLVEA